MRTASLLLAGLLAACLIPFHLQAEEPQKKDEKRTKFELELDPYYSSVDLYASLTSKPIPHVGQKSEAEIYKELLKKFYLPRDLVLEASFNPLPYSAALVRRSSPELYQSAKVNNSLNAIHALTAGFEEPWAASLFFGNVIAFDSGTSFFYHQRKSYFGKRHGYSGFLISAGDSHIKDDTIVADPWAEVECKLKGEQFLEQSTLKWSFRVGAKFHGNQDIADSVYFGLKRDILNFGNLGNFFLANSGFEYVFDVRQKDLSGIRHFFLINKKLPIARYRIAAKLSLGVVWTSDKKYSGSLASSNVADRRSIQIILRPNIVF